MRGVSLLNVLIYELICMMFIFETFSKQLQSRYLEEIINNDNDYKTNSQIKIDKKVFYADYFQFCISKIPSFIEQAKNI